MSARGVVSAFDAFAIVGPTLVAVALGLNLEIGLAGSAVLAVMTLILWLVGLTA